MVTKAREPSAAARQARGPSAAARQARGPSAADRQTSSLPQCQLVTAKKESERERKNGRVRYPDRKYLLASRQL